MVARDFPGGMRGLYSDAMPGGRSETPGDEHAQLPASKCITLFSYHRKGFTVKLTKDAGGTYQYYAAGGSNIARDGSQFRIEYPEEDETLLKDLKGLIVSRQLYKDNGHTVHVGGLPADLGDALQVEYESGEKIRKSSNQSHMLDDYSAKLIYEAFRSDAVRHGLDFNTKGSNQVIYDDPTEAYLQGTWKGTHFGDEFIVVFTGKHVVITVNGSVTDDTDYVIAEGSVYPDRLREKPIGSSSPARYENFSSCLCFHKKNSFTITGEADRSTFELHNFDK